MLAIPCKSEYGRHQELNQKVFFDVLKTANLEVERPATSKSVINCSVKIGFQSKIQTTRIETDESNGSSFQVVNFQSKIQTTRIET